MKPNLTFYGGKQNLSKKIISLIPKNKLYCEPFFGGGAVFFAKEPSPVEVINDLDGELINFYQVVKTKFKPLQKEIRATLHSRELHQQANTVLKNPKLFDEVKRAWAIWVLANQSYGSIMGSSWGYDKTESATARRLYHKRNNFTEEYAKRLEKVQIDCNDALTVMASRDTKDSFFYVDPPYFNSHCGHYRGYTETDFENLLKLLSAIKGKFLLSSYPSPLLDKYIKKNKWDSISVEMNLSMTPPDKRNHKKKTEVLTANYKLT